MALAYVQIRGLDFGSYTDKSRAKYMISLYNPVTGAQSKFFKFNYTNNLTFRAGYSLEFVSHQNQYFTIQIHKKLLTKKILVAKVDVPLSEFPINQVCPVKLAAVSEKPQFVPMTVSFAVHLDTLRSGPMKAPLGESKLKSYETNNNDYFNYSFVENNALESNLI